MERDLHFSILVRSPDEDEMAKKRRYSKKASSTVESAMRRRKHGTLKSGSGGKVTSRKQAIAIGLSEAREKGAKVPRKRAAKKSSRKTGARKR
jgi:hypothetical protein